jgi:hypothetical protein
MLLLTCIHTTNETNTQQEASTGQPLPPTIDEPLPRVAHVYWHPSSSQWVLHLDLDPALNYDHYLGYAKVRK